MKLSDAKVRNFKPAAKIYRKTDGENLFVEVKPNGTKLWKMAYRFGGKQKTLSFGVYPDVSLSMARQRKQDARRLLAEGIDPRAREKEIEEERLSQEKFTFANVAEELLQKLEKDKLAPATLKKKRWLIGFANPTIGDIPIKELKASDVHPALRKVEARGTYETAKRVRSTIGQVCRYAVATARADGDPTQALKGALVAPSVKHMAALTKKEDFEQLVRAIWDYQGGSLEIRTALKLMVLLYPRPGELRKAVWEEFDLEKGTWTIPAERMKSRRQHKKPLPRTAIHLLRSLRSYGAQQTLTFASILSYGKPISENTLNQALRRMGFRKDEATSHGFRASASSLINESGKWNIDAIEAELSHIGADQVRRAYNRSVYWDERVEMAEWWAEEIRSML
ncbi:tyrosine-type recombinase/integrase [Algimonas porphyrae]|uniref:Integrase n=1 Tax=Algimonas porphyrae TaxID=1128113 RepID=A0ABQ5V059_9PROT|nr:integrase arm-type DNA-binding domain-containing protein [Algimonas porphyrae]GLQ20876.1 integrase [Algimonas porphyrae]